MNMHALMLVHTCAHACIAAHMDLYIIVMAYSHTLKYIVHLHIQMVIHVHVATCTVPLVWSSLHASGSASVVFKNGKGSFTQCILVHMQ